MSESRKRATMDDLNRNYTNETMEKIIGNMTAERQNADGQYVPLAYTPPPASGDMQWTRPQPSYINYGAHAAEPIMGRNVDGYSTGYNYIQQPGPLFGDFDAYNRLPNGASDLNLLDSYIYGTAMPHLQPNIMQNQPEAPTATHNHTLIDNLVGNWVIPNNTGTYSPFGTTETFKTNVFDVPTGGPILNHQFMDEAKFMPKEEDKPISFNRDNRKPRMVAEVKPMRPSYSDVLTKPVPQTVTKPLKSDVKDTKPKKDNKKSVKVDKSVKSAPRNPNTADPNTKDSSNNAEKPAQKMEKSKSTKPNQMPRKWSSLDNITENAAGKTDDKKRKVEDKDKSFAKSSKKLNKTVNDLMDMDAEPVKVESLAVNKNGLKKVQKAPGRPKPNDSFGGSERPPGKRNQRTRKRETHVPFGFVGQKLKQYTKGWWKLIAAFIVWLFHLISDICSLSIHISKDLASNTWTWIRTHGSLLQETTVSVFKDIRFISWIREKFKGRKPDTEDEEPDFAQTRLPNNINMPTTGDEAMKRLLACKGKDPYSILGVTPRCTDDDIKRYYKRQAFLVHPDKNALPGAEEAFKILVHAFDMIGEPERRAAYDRGVVESAQVVQAWSELNDLLQQLQQKVQAAANTIRCSACGFRHKRVKTERPSYAARNCSQCKIHHGAREGDIWAEAKVYGFLWHYYACMEGAVYDITEWAGCQKESLKHLRPDSHHVQYRIALGKQNTAPRRHSASPRPEQPNLENLLNTLYGQNDAQGMRRRYKKAK